MISIAAHGWFCCAGVHCTATHIIEIGFVLQNLGWGSSSTFVVKFVHVCAGFGHEGLGLMV